MTINRPHTEILTVPEYPNHVWSYDFVEDRTHNGKKYRMLNIIDEFTANAWRSE